MEQEHRIVHPEFSWEEAALIRLLEQAMRDGVVRRDRLDFHLSRLKLSPEAVAQYYEALQTMDIRLVEEMPEPEYTEEQRQAIRQRLEQTPSDFSERERMILEMRFVEGLDLTRTAEQMGLSRERIRQIESRAIRKKSSRKKIRDFYE